MLRKIITFCLALVVNTAISAELPVKEVDTLEVQRQRYLTIYSGELAAGVHCLQFHYIGQIVVENKSCPVFLCTWVVEGKMAPSGSREIVVFNYMPNTLRIKVSDDGSKPPLYCEGSSIILAGRTGLMPRSSGGKKHNGNIIRFKSGDYDFFDEKIYGSSGGIDDSIPTAQEREIEIQHWDDK